MTKFMVANLEDASECLINLNHITLISKYGEDGCKIFFLNSTGSEDFLSVVNSYDIVKDMILSAEDD